MGLAWKPEDAGHVVADVPDREWAAGPRHRRPTLLARSGQVVAGRFTALAGTDPGASHHGASDPGTVQSAGLHVMRRAALPARRYWA
jgi:hypothetical protein